jgi:hypothetical protein
MLRARVIATAARMVSEQHATMPADVTKVQVVAATPGLPTVVSPDDEDQVSSGEGV